MRVIIPLNSLKSSGMFCARGFTLLTLLAVALCARPILTAQTAPSPSTTAHKPVHHKRLVAAPALSSETKVEPVPAAPAPTKPAEPELPVWPANQKAVTATVTWNSQGLHIEADNSSLQQILKDVATATGTEINGNVPDQRIFGEYGPGQVSEVLSQLLHGFGYNVLMVGDQGQGTPRQIVLSSRNGEKQPAVSKAAPVAEEDADTEEPQQPPQPNPPRPDFIPTAPPRTAQEAMQMRLQQRQPQPNNPPNQPPN